MVWSPEDENDLPTLLERTFAREAINTLQEEMEKTLATAEKLEQELQRTRAEAEILKHEIFKRVVWLAPIRRIPMDVLSLFFIEACRSNWEAPLILAAVCRGWRNVLIGTPRAWAFIQITPLSHPFHHELVDIWLPRCGALLVDISLHPATPLATVDAVCRHEQNLRSISFFGNTKQLRRQYSQLEELRLSSVTRLPLRLHHLNRYIELSEVHKSEEEGIFAMRNKFPKLLSLHLHHPLPKTMEIIAHRSLFPSLQELHIPASSRYWLHIIQLCASSLTTLTIEVNSTCVDSVPAADFEAPIMCPRLQHLQYINMNITTTYTRWPSLHTPTLQSYNEYGGQGISPIHAGVSSATSVLLHQPEDVSWSSFPSLSRLRFRDTTNRILRQMTILAANPTICPSLSFVQCTVVGSSGADEVNIAPSLERRSIMTGKSIVFHCRDAEYDPRVDNSQCYTFCQSHSPSNHGDWDPYEEVFTSLDQESSDGQEYYEPSGHSDRSSDDWDYYNQNAYEDAYHPQDMDEDYCSV